MILTEHQKNELDVLADSVAYYIEDHLRETISWQMPDALVEDLQEDQFMDAMDYAYNKVLQLMTE
jgi:cell division septal protein FtsQ